MYLGRKTIETSYQVSKTLTHKMFADKFYESHKVGQSAMYAVIYTTCGTHIAVFFKTCKKFYLSFFRWSGADNAVPKTRIKSIETWP